MSPSENAPAATGVADEGGPLRVRTSPQETHALAGYPDIRPVTTMDLPPDVPRVPRSGAPESAHAITAVSSAVQ